MPKRGRVWLNRLWLPPYNADEATMWPPCPISVATARTSAAWPLAVATAPTPPSSAATRSPMTAPVGLESRDRKSVVWGQLVYVRVVPAGRRPINNKHNKNVAEKQP